MKVDRFEDLLVWKKSKELAVIIYKHFESIKDYGFREQILRASVSVMNNIAEGFERKTNNEFKQFLFIAKGSSGELRSMLYLALETNKISESEFKSLCNSSLEISKMLSGLIKKL
ncbi:MAG: four helix bundle protein [Bacteroidales bacterium]|nr:four helix bundle protein [Bacteroidales bacterium]